MMMIELIKGNAFYLGRILEDKSYKGNLILKPGDEIIFIQIQYSMK